MEKRPNPKAIREASERAKALADPTRLAIAIELRRAYPNSVSATTMNETIGRDGSVVSRHCTKLRNAGLVERDYFHHLANFKLTEPGKALVDAVLAES